MARKKGRKKKANKNDIGMAYHVEGPRGMSRATVYRAMIESIRNGGKPLPPGINVTWKWRNSKKQRMRSAPFLQAIRKSRAGFLVLMERRITRDASRLPNWEAPPPVRKATAKETRAIERAEERTQERREAKARKGEGTRARETALFEKRSAAARKGWITRRAAAKSGRQRK